MGWLKGSSDCTDLKADLYGLLTGALAASNRGTGQAGNGVTLASGDAWSGIDATNYVIRSKDTIKPWTLPITMWRGMPRFSLWVDPTTQAITMGKPTFSGVYAGGPTRCSSPRCSTHLKTGSGRFRGTTGPDAIHRTTR